MWTQGRVETPTSDFDLPQANPKPLGVSEEKNTELHTKQGSLPS